MQPSQSSQENPSPGVPVGETSRGGAADALREVRTARERAMLRAGLVPAWFGPAVAFTLVLPSVVRAWSLDRGGWTTAVSLLVSLLGLASIVALVAVAKRRVGVLVARSWSARLRRSRVTLPTVLAVGLLAGACCWALGTERETVHITAFAVWGLGAWAAFTARNAAVRQSLRNLA